jgi:hypothetical protein
MRVVVVCRFYGDQEPIGALGHNKNQPGLLLGSHPLVIGDP